MTRRLVLATCVLALAGGVAAPALAADTQRHKLCVLGPTPQAPDQEGICIGWDDPSLPPAG